ncbi:DUF3800 domain-containing protein [Sporosarcina limicola]|uniref:Uncharacterized protein n=1 Tax=Sporosarcina limicola TaxID=34101 RepID=A0A927R8C6_9BACL|nr:DUF3800 domain-containing protein [Sporosarcina limicola]MBE1556874.1 hypothetical protein [Sporosarcina limicola]
MSISNERVIEMDYSDLRKQAIAFYKYFDSTLDFDIKSIFYYDETNNCRKFRIKDGHLNIDKNKDFVLGGVVLDMDNKEKIESSFNSLKDKLKIQPQIKEIKLKNVCSQGSDFLKCISGRKMRDYLTWLLKYDIYIHYAMMDNLYYAIVDIVDSLFDFNGDLQKTNFFKTLLYQFVYNNTESFVEIFERYNYPNIRSEQSVSFFDDMIDSIESTNNLSSNYLKYKDFLIKLFQENKYKEPLFLINNKDNIIIEEYYLMYKRNIYMFKNSFHFFDEEVEVENKMHTMILHGNRLENYNFIKSHNNIFIQLSDITVGMLGKLFEFIKPIRSEDVEYVYYSLNKYQTEGFDLLKSLIHKSYEKNGAFRNMSMNQELNNKFDILMGFKEPV